MNTDTYKVYLHRKATDGEVFYVGIAKNQKESSNYDRPTDTWNRTKKWKEVYRQCGRDVEIHMDNLSLDEAMNEESRLISHYGRLDRGTGQLVNRTSGGQSCNGTPMPKGKECPFSNLIVDVHTGEVKFYGYRQVAEKLGVDKSHVGKVLRPNGKYAIAQYDWGLMLKSKYDYLIKRGIDPVAYLKKRKDAARRRWSNAQKYERTEEHKALMRQRLMLANPWKSITYLKGKDNPMAKGVINVETGETWSTVVEAAKANNMSRYAMGKRCQGKIKKEKQFRFISKSSTL
jgi:hypothetical protein